MAEKLNVTDVQQWLKDQSLMYASHPASGDRRLRLVYYPANRTWETYIGIGGVKTELYYGSDVNHAVAAFNREVS